MSTTPTTTSRRRKPQEFHLPDGRKVVVALPDDLLTVRQRYEALPDTQVEVVLHGSDEHHTYLRESKDHHEKRRQDLRELHGPAFDEWESVQAQLDAVSDQLDKLADKTSALNANFNKFGYNALLRTYDDDSGGEGPKSGKLSSNDGTSSLSIWGDINNGETIKLFKRPVIKQYFHKGLLWRASEETVVMSFELFFDLLYVGIIHVNGEHVAEGADGRELLRFVVTFIMSWKIWADITQLISWFETDDVLQRLEILFVFACLLGFTTNMIQSFAEDAAHNTYTQMVSFYLAARLFSAAHCIMTGALLPLVRGMMISQVVLTLLPSALWIGSIHVEMPSRIGLIFAALFLDICGGSTIVAAFRYSRSHTTPLAEKLGRWFEFFPAMNIEHKVERTNAFVSLVLGYSVISVLFQNYGFGINAFLGKAVLGLCQAFLFNWLYFDVDGSNIHLHAIRRKVWSATVWSYAHLPFILGYVLASAALSKLVVATDCPNTDAHDLTHLYEERSEPELSNGIRFFYCYGLAVALLSMGAIAFSHEHKIPREMRIPKLVRLANRLGVVLIMFLLPLAKNLNSLHLISITVGLMVWVLLLEIWGKSCKHDSFWPKDCRTRYAAKCSKKDLERAMKDDGEVDVVELGKGEKTGVIMQP